MEKSILEISSDGWYLSAEHGFVILSNRRSGQESKKAFDEILSVIFSARDTAFSKNLITKLSENNIPVVFTNSNYIPECITLPLVGRGELRERMEAQINASEPLKKNMWREIVKAKIAAQKDNLKKHHPESINAIKAMDELAATVKSGDSENNEAQAAKIYFKSLFGANFARDRDKPDANVLLNYAYTILRAAVARSTVSAGLLPYLGIKHCNRFNTMPLVDDLIEPFRAIADDAVYDLLPEIANPNEITMTSDLKRKITPLLYTPVKAQKGKTDLMTAIHQYALSVANSFLDKKCIIDFPARLL